MELGKIFAEVGNLTNDGCGTEITHFKEPRKGGVPIPGMYCLHSGLGVQLC